MYDFEGDASKPSDAHEATAAGGAPSRLLTAAELPRWIVEYSSSRALDVLPPRRRRGQGRPVLVIPGFSATDQLTGRLRAHLRRQGFHVHGWGQGRNVGLTDTLVDGLVARFEELRERHDEPISVVGWSFGGLLARWLAHTYPADVRQVICLGSPWRAEGERTRATAMFERSRIKHGISDRAVDMVTLLREPVPVPLTAIWSRTDGIVPWRGCAVADIVADVAPGAKAASDTSAAAGPVAEDIVVHSSHVGMVANPLVLAAVVDRLTQDLADWRPFTWQGALTGTARTGAVA